MRTINVNLITQQVCDAVQKINLHTPDPTMIRLTEILQTEPSPAGRAAMQDIVANRQIATTHKVPMCQDTGMVIVLVELGQDVHLAGGDIREAIADGVRKGYQEGYLRKSVVSEPLFEHRNAGDNTRLRGHDWEIIRTGQNDWERVGFFAVEASHCNRRKPECKYPFGSG